MPELPEVETIVQGLKRTILNKQIEKIEIREKKPVKNIPEEFKSILKNNAFTDITRRGKLLIFALKNSHKSLFVHLKMTGQLVYTDKKKSLAGGHQYPAVDNLPNKHSHVIFVFSDKSRLFFNDIRKFGYMKLVSDEEKNQFLQKIGKEPLSDNFTLPYFLNVLKGKKAPIKSLLINQKLIAGIGNIYADEICFEAKVHPEKSAGKLTVIEKKSLFKAIPLILNKAVLKKGTTFNNYQDSEGKKGNFQEFLRVHRQEGQKCKRCGTIIKKIKVAGRGTYFCPGCQK